MIKIENTDVYGFEAAIRGMRNPWNSWKKSDSEFEVDCATCNNPLYPDCESCPVANNSDKSLIGTADLGLMKKLVAAGTDHSKFMRMITVYVDVTAPMYWWKEFDTYKVGTVRNSCSTMHKITEKEFTLDDFSHEHLDCKDIIDCDTLGYTDEATITNITLMDLIVEVLNFNREKYLETKDKLYWRGLIQLLPSSYNQRATLMLNYEVLANIYHSRRNHRLDEWRDFCRCIESLPYSELITGEETARNGWAKVGS